MSGLLIGAVLFAAILHAGWNTIAKWIPDRLVASALIGVSFAAGGAVGALVLPMPSFEAWPFVIASSALQVGYMLLLTSAYSHGEFGRVYPLARGLSPVLVTARPQGKHSEPANSPRRGRRCCSRRCSASP